MEESPSASPAAGASKLLANLPNRGILSSTVSSPNLGGARVYLCDHDTSPPEDQLIKTNQLNILIRSLMLKKQKGELSSKDAKGPNDSSRKRVAERSADDRASIKRAMSSTQSSSQKEGTKLNAPDKNFQSLTVERLRLLLKEKGLSPRGKKDELIARLRSVSS